MANKIDREAITRELLRAGVEPPAWLDKWLADHENGLADPLVFLPSPQGLVPVLLWTDGLRRAIAQAVKKFEDHQQAEMDNGRERNGLL